MTNLRARESRRSAPVLLLAATVLTGTMLAGCAATAGSGSSGDPVPPTGPIAAPGEVLGQGTVLQQGDEAPQLCLGAVAESYPPQCSGPEVIGWDWTTADLEETASEVTWGTYAVIGTWDGVAFTVTGMVIPLALYDPLMREPDPRTLPENAGDSSEATLTSIQDDITASAADEGSIPVLTAWSENGYLWVTVTYDDGTIQAYYDAVYGPDIVVVQSALRDVAP
jgi:hypothetical protein